MRRPAILALVLGAWTSLAVSTALADPIPLLAGRQLQALSWTKVRIVDEDLSIALTLDRMEVKAMFHLKNQGERIELPVGFPCEPDVRDMAGMSCAAPLDVTVKGKTIKTRKDVVEGYGPCWVWTMRLDKDEEIPLEIRYAAKIVNERYEVPLAGIWLVYYPLRTGSNWAGSIGRLAVTVSLPVETIVHISPEGYSRGPGRIEWRFEDYEPREDLFVVLEPYRTSRYIYDFLIPKAGAKIDAGEKAAFAESFLAELPRYLESYVLMSEVFRSLRVPLPLDMERVVRESADIMRRTPQDVGVKK